ncbi:PhnB protein [Nitrosospira sp. Nsp11]|jgi:PhnB protein|uniref:VOC family protein n=1 Tax=Nitrosospira sp. Nsp11 TaxID=1855338 RepID=UPI00091492A9|nr:VOC family protein [Nitrosospira sp. Nsp11]SHL36051.1 PhnB protein [Nitrosospira sp. Nsp11]
MTTKPIPDGYHTLTPYLMINGAAKAIEFYTRAFNAVELFRMDTPGGKIGHAEIQIGDSRIMLADDFGGERIFRSSQSGAGSPVGLHLYVKDVDAMFAQATSAGAEVIRPVQDQFYGDRTGGLEDPFGHIWFIATHKEDLSLDEIKQRAAAMFKQGGADT